MTIDIKSNSDLTRFQFLSPLPMISSVLRPIVLLLRPYAYQICMMIGELQQTCEQPDRFG